MANRYCDHGIYGTPVAAGTVPSAAEDGNGKAIGAATMATLSITFSGIPAAGGTITIAGVTFTAVASGATGNQFNAVVDATTCATNLQAAINASTTNCVAPVGAIATTAPLRNVVNACRSGAVLTIYTRCAGTEWNSVTESSTLTNASITSQWSGGGDGAWGYLNNPASIAWPTAISTIGGYGVMGNARPYVGSVTAGDTIHIRSGKTLTFSSTWTAFSPAFLGTAAAYTVYSVGDPAVWGDSADAELLVNVANTQDVTFISSSILYAVFQGGRKTDGTQRTKVMRSVTGGAGNTALTLGLTANSVIEDVLFSHSAASTNCSVQVGGSANAEGLARRCRFHHMLVSLPHVKIVANTPQGVIFEDCEFSTAAGTPATSVLSIGNGSSVNTHVFSGCKFTGFVAGSILCNSVAGNNVHLTFEECDFGNVSKRAPNGGVIAQWSSIGPRQADNYLIASQSFGQQDFTYDLPCGCAEWNSLAAYPTLNAVLRDGVTKHSWHLYPSRISGRVRLHTPAEFPLITKINTLADGQRTFTLEALIENTLAASLTKKNMWMVVSYTDTSGVRRQVTTQDFSGAALTASTAAWSATDYNDGGLVAHSRYKFEVTTPAGQGVKLGSDMTFYIAVGFQPSVSTQGLFIDPEIVVA